MIKTSKGFTLIEILIAIAIFAILASITASTMYYAFNTRNHLQQTSSRLYTTQFALIWLKHDISQLTLRAVRGNEFHYFPAFIGRSNYIELTRGGIINPPTEEKRSTMQRVAYFCQDNNLIRRTWPVLDTPKRENFTDRVLLTALNACNFGYLDKNLHVLSEWRANLMPNSSNQQELPRAIQVNLDSSALGKASFVFLVVEGIKSDFGNHVGNTK